MPPSVPSSSSPRVPPAVVFEGVSFAYPGGPPVLEDVSLRLAAGCRVGVVGPNGGGKSTLLKLMLGLLQPSRGRIQTLGGPPVRARRRGRVGVVLQSAVPESGFPLSARQAVAGAIALRAPRLGGLRADARAAVDRAIEVVGACAYAQTPVGRLSGGQLQRVLLARALAVKPEILALDEPLVGVDPEGQARFADLLHRVASETGVTVVMVSHQLRSVAAVCDSVLCVSRRVRHHDASDGLTPEVLAEVYGCVAGAGVGAGAGGFEEGGAWCG